MLQVHWEWDQRLGFQACPACQGLWISHEQLLDCLRKEGWTPRPAQSPATRVGTPKMMTTRQCPQCAGQRLEVIKVCQIEADRCPKCKGLWLDAGELRAIVQWHRNRAKHPVSAKSTAFTFMDGASAAGSLRACLKTPQKRRVRARGLQGIVPFGHFCRPGALTGRVFKQAPTDVVVTEAAGAIIDAVAESMVEGIGNML